VAKHFTDHGGEGDARATVDIFYNVNDLVERPRAGANDRAVYRSRPLQRRVRWLMAGVPHLIVECLPIYERHWAPRSAPACPQ
jgi:hypothetical protein